MRRHPVRDSLCFMLLELGFLSILIADAEVFHSAYSILPAASPCPGFPVCPSSRWISFPELLVEFPTNMPLNFHFLGQYSVISMRSPKIPIETFETSLGHLN